MLTKKSINSKDYKIFINNNYLKKVNNANKKNISIVKTIKFS